MADAIKVGIYDLSGRKIDEIVYDFQTVSWLINGTGQLPMTLPYSNTKVTRDNFIIGKLVAAQFSNGLPLWAGVMDTPLRQTATGISVTVYSAERLLSFRETTKTLKATGPPGAIFKQIIQNINSEFDTGIRFGTISVAGDATERIYHYSNALSSIQELSKTFNNDWAILPFLDDQGKLTFKAYWWTQRGVDRTVVVVLEEGKNAELTLESQGQVASRVRAAGSGSSWGDARLVATANNEDTRTLYGFREKTVLNTNTANSAVAVQAAADGLASTLNAPLSRLTAMTTNQAPGLFADYDIGDRVRVRAFLKASPEWVIDAAYRVRGRELLSSNVCRLTLEVN